MATTTVTRRLQRNLRRAVARRTRRAPPPAPARRPARPAIELETVASHWQLAIDAADRAVTASAPSLGPAERAVRREALGGERTQVATLIADVARLTRVRPAPWLSPVPVSTRSLGLRETVQGCLFDLDGVLTDSGTLHAWAWGRVFDDLLMRVAERAGWQFIPFDRRDDYREYLDGRSRLEGIHAFLGSRGIRLPEGHPDDPPGLDTAWALARRKGDTLAVGMRRRRVTPLTGARRYLEVAGRVGLKRGVISASASTLPMLELAGLATVVEGRIDAALMARAGLRARPAPDVLLAACRHLDVAPGDAVAFTHSAIGVAAARAAGMTAIGVADEPDRPRLEAAGAERVVPSLDALLDAHLRASGAAAARGQPPRRSVETYHSSSASKTS